MNIYIPNHIRKIGIVDKMCKLIEAYSTAYKDNSADSFNDYYYYLNTDPVKKFLHFCIPESEWNTNGEHKNEDYESVISYISRLFYSVKGTCKVFDLMKKYLNLEIDNITYNVKTLSFTISEVILVDIDEKVFYDSLIDFLNALLYFGSANIQIDVIKLHIANTLYNYTGANIVTYKEYTTVNYDSR